MNPDGEAFLREIAGALKQGRRCCLRLRVPRMDAFAWLCTQASDRKLLWSDRAGGWVAAGLGVAEEWKWEGPAAPDWMSTLRSELKAYPAPDIRVYGGLSFLPTQADPEWRPYGNACFVLPRWELRCEPAGAVLRLHLQGQESLAEIAAEWEALQGFRVHDVSCLPPIVARQDDPGPAGWQANVEEALTAIARGDVEKVVLARRAAYRFAEPVRAEHILAVLRPVTGQCFHFLFQPGPGTAFMGTPPERLFLREGDRLFTESLAGTRPRGATADEDAALQAELLGSEKEAREHGVVRTMLVNALSPLCNALQVEPEPSLLQLERKQHLITRFAGIVRPGVRDEDLLAALHPTPAVGGSPREAALALLTRLEPFSRGWYAAPVGWLGLHAAEFAVAIRSGRVEGTRVHVYSGAGIVQGSVAEKEWEEIEHKISDFVTVTRGVPRG